MRCLIEQAVDRELYTNHCQIHPNLILQAVKWYEELNYQGIAPELFIKRQKKKKGLTYFVAEGSSASKLLFSGSDSTTLFSTFCLQENERQLQLKNRIYLKQSSFWL